MTDGKVQLWGGKLLCVGGKVATADDCCCPGLGSCPDMVVDLGAGGWTAVSDARQCGYFVGDNGCEEVAGEFTAEDWGVGWPGDQYKCAKKYIGTGWCGREPAWFVLWIYYYLENLDHPTLDATTRWQASVLVRLSNDEAICNECCSSVSYESDIETGETAYDDLLVGGSISLDKVGADGHSSCDGPPSGYTLCDGTLPDTITATPVS